MEEDIKILETVINYRKIDGIYSTNEVVFKAIENLIKVCKELEENNIPKSVIREKIEELKKIVKKETQPLGKEVAKGLIEFCSYLLIENGEKIEDIQELLEG